MFNSETLVRITIQVPEPLISAATGVLVRFRLLHLIRIDQTPLGRLGYVAPADEGLTGTCERLLGQIQELLEPLGIPAEDAALDRPVEPEKDLLSIQARLAAIEGDIGPLVKDLAAVEETLAHTRTRLDRLERLPPDLDLARLSRCDFVAWTVGLITSEGLDRLQESLSRVHHAVVELGSLAQRTVVLVFGLKPDWPAVERALAGAFVEPVPLAPIPPGGLPELMAALRSQAALLAARREKLVEERPALQRRFAGELLELYRQTLAAQQSLAARRWFGKVDRSYLISGWIPEKRLAPLADELARATGGQALVERVAPEESREMRNGIVKIPILFNNPLLISPFEKLTRLYGTPRYREVEPTVFFAASFLLMFGMMFGDVGQGGVLFLFGYLLFRRSYRYTDYGIILMECGLFSSLFGFLYGSVFGLDTLIPALWFRPMADITYFVKVALVLGAGLLSLGMALNLVNALRLKEYDQLFDGGGLAGALLYWLAAGLGIKYLLTGRIAPGELTALGWAAAALMAVIVFHRPVHRLIARGNPTGRGPGQAGFLADLAESVVGLFDDLIRYAANTVSFVRVAAFALSHAALFLAVFSIADIVSHEKKTTFSYWIVVAVGNLVIILLEGLVVSIQAVRLEYYEFFGNFFRGGGERFKPFGETDDGDPTGKN